jgi:hypothetical protein
MSTVVDTDALIVGRAATFAGNSLDLVRILSWMMVDAGPRLTKQAGPDHILGDLAFANENSHDLRLLSGTLCTLTGNGEIMGATLCHLPSGKYTEVKASV